MLRTRSSLSISQEAHIRYFLKHEYVKKCKAGRSRGGCYSGDMWSERKKESVKSEVLHNGGMVHRERRELSHFISWHALNVRLHC